MICPDCGRTIQTLDDHKPGCQLLDALLHDYPPKDWLWDVEEIDNMRLTRDQALALIRESTEEKP